MTPGTLYYGDCLKWMQEWPRGVVDLIYLDPPFNSNTNYNMLWGRGRSGPSPFRAFDDTWRWDQAAAMRVEVMSRAVEHPAHLSISWFSRSLRQSGMLAYLSYMAQRLTEMHRILKSKGRIYVHCDPTASHYLKIIMDEIFTGRNFLREIVWRRTSAHSDAKRCGVITDRLLVYSKGSDRIRNQQFISHEDVDRNRLLHEGPEGRVWTDDGFITEEPSTRGHRVKHKGGASRRRVSVETMPQPDSERRPRFTSSGRAAKNHHFDEGGHTPQDLWGDISPINSQSKERLGYPTQKPLDLLERVIGLSSNPGDTVLDPFCGSGTTIEAAHALKRNWVGIDISLHAIDLIAERRLKLAHPRVEGMPKDMDTAMSLARSNPRDFEAWAVTRIPGLSPSQKKTGGEAIDGNGSLLAAPLSGDEQSDLTLVLGQVKSEKFSLSHLRDFCGVVMRKRAALGVYITLDAEPTTAAKREMTRMGHVRIGSEEYPRVQMWSIRDYFEQRKPHLPGLADPYTGAPAQELLFR